MRISSKNFGKSREKPAITSNVLLWFKAFWVTLCSVQRKTLSVYVGKDGLGPGGRVYSFQAFSLKHIRLLTALHVLVVIFNRRDVNVYP